MKTVMAFGTFDKVHPGHLFFLNEAKKLGDKLIVVIGRDETVRTVKGHSPLQNELERKEGIERTGIADEVLLGSITSKYAHIHEKNPDIIALGYDQQVFTDKISETFPHIQVVRIPSFHPDQYKSSILNKQK